MSPLRNSRQVHLIPSSTSLFTTRTHQHDHHFAVITNVTFRITVHHQYYHYHYLQCQPIPIMSHQFYHHYHQKILKPSAQKVVTTITTNQLLYHNHKTPSLSLRCQQRLHKTRHYYRSKHSPDSETGNIITATQHQEQRNQKW